MKIPFYSLASNDKHQQKFVREIEKVIQSNDFILGKELKEFEASFAAYCECKDCVGVGNGLDALKLSLQALNVTRGDEVIVPAHTFIATWLAVSSLGAIPVPVDVAASNMNMDINLIEEKISAKTKAIIPVHLYGLMCDMTPLLKLAKKHNLFIVEDFAQAHGATYNGKKAGSFGHLNATSFYPSKNLGAMGDGGAIVGRKIKLVNKARKLGNYGSTKKYFHDVKGINSRLDNLQATILKVKLKELDRNNKKRQQIAKWYTDVLCLNEHITLQEDYPNSKSVYHLYVIRSQKRDQLQKYLAKHGIGTLIHYPIPTYAQEAYMDLNYKKNDYPVTESISKTCLSLPIYPGLRKSEVLYIAETISKFYK